MQNKIKFILITIFLFSFSCKPVTVGKTYLRDGKEYGVTIGLFNGKWWNYIERGESFLAGNFLAEAEADLKQAIGKRFEDQRQARTYGMHFVEYFPHRELGIVYLQQARLEEAEKELLLSLSQEETGRAKFYLNRVRKGIITKRALDKEPPLIQPDFPGDKLFTGDLFFTLSGKVIDDQFVSEISINGEGEFIELAENKILFSRKIKLKPGENQIQINAVDLSGKISHKKLSVTLDRVGPLLTIDTISQEQGKYKIKGNLFDESGLAKLTFGGQEFNPEGKKEFLFEQGFQVSPGKNLSFLATDSAGNTTKGEIKLDALIAIKERRVQLAYNDAPSFAGDGHLIKIAANKDIDPPVIKLKSGLENNLIVFQNSFFIEGTLTDPGKVAGLSINGEALNLRSGIEVYYNYIGELKTGKNDFILVARDQAGNEAKKIITVERKEPALAQENNRLAAAILPFQEKGANRDLFPMFGDSFLSALMEKERFRIVSRGETFETLLKELKLSSTDLVDKSTALRLGKIVAAELIIKGSLTETPQFLQFFAEVIDSETSEVIAATDVYGEDKSISSFKQLIGGLSLKIIDRFPRVEGTVVKVKDKTVYIDVGNNKKVKPNTRFFLFRKAEDEFADMEMIQEVKVTEVFEKAVKAEFVREIKKTPVQLKDLAIAK